MEPLVSCNYILKIYEDNDPENLVLTRRFYVLDRKVSVDARVVRSSRVAERDKRQKLDFSIYHPNLQISNPFAEIKVRVMQNAREDNAWWVTRPGFVKAAQLGYNRSEERREGKEWVST